MEFYPKESGLTLDLAVVAQVTQEQLKNWTLFLESDFEQEWKLPVVWLSGELILSGLSFQASGLFCKIKKIVERGSQGTWGSSVGSILQ